MQQFTVSRDETIYEAWPDVTKTESGALVCVFSECTHHGDRAYTRIVTRTSENRGRTWSGKRPVTAPLYRERPDDPYWNCARIVTLRNGRLAVVVDRVAGEDEGNAGGEQRNWLWFSDDGGETWDGPHRTPVTGIVPDQLVELEHGEHAGRWLLGAHTVDRGSGADGEGRWMERIWISDDRGASWEGPATVASEPGLRLCEGSVVELPSGELVCFLRENSGEGRDCFKAISDDGGETWDGVYEMPIPACHRPVAGVLNSGNVLVTHRFMQGGGGWLGTWTQNTFAALTDAESCLARDREEARTRIRPLGYDRSEHADTGYTGWVQFDDGEIYVVDYAVDDAPAAPVREPDGYDGEYADAPKAQIRGYAFDERDLVIESRET